MYLLHKCCKTIAWKDLKHSIEQFGVSNSDIETSKTPMSQRKKDLSLAADTINDTSNCYSKAEVKHKKYVKELSDTDSVSAMTPTSALLSGSHNVMTFSAATARTDPSAEKVADVIGFFLQNFKRSNII